jgi:Cytochrome P450
MGNSMYVLTGIRDVSEIDRTFERTSFEVFERRFLSSCGASESLLDKLYAILNPKKVLDGLPLEGVRNQSLNRLTHDMHIKQLSQGGHLDAFVSVGKDYFEKQLRFENVVGKHYVSRSQGRELELSLMPFVSGFFVSANQRMLFGDRLFEVDPKLVWTFIDLDDRIWQLLMNVPALLAPKVCACRDQMIQSINAYLDIPHEKRADGSWWLRTYEEQMRPMGLSTREMATVIVPMYIGSVIKGSSEIVYANRVSRSATSTRKACFWMLSFMLFNPHLIEIVRKETEPAIRSDEVDLEYLKLQCPQLNAIWTETLRMSTSAGSFRLIREDTAVNGKTLRKGQVLLIPARQLHFDKDVFGAEVESFHHERFLAGKALGRSRSMRPFGGGFNHCPGRFAAYQQTLIFVALLLHRFDVELVGTQRFPRWAEDEPFPGMMAPKDHDDLNIRLQMRQTKCAASTKL